jgi:dCMP deaminase
MNNREDDKQMLLMTDDFAIMSKDPSTKVGAIIVNEGEDDPKSFGYNGMPRGLDDYNVERNERPEKYFWYEHAERNAIYNKAQDLMTDAVIFCSHFPNMESARGIVSSGIKMVITDYDDVFHAKYLKLRKENKLETSPEHKNYERVQVLFKETGVQLYQPSRALLKNGYFSGSNTEMTSKEKTEFSTLKKYITFLDITKKYGLIKGKYERKASAFILNKKTMVPIGIGLYAPPHGFDNITEERAKEKQFWFIDAEKNAIFNAVRPQLKNSAVYASWCPCMDCALAIVAVGAKKVVTRKPEFKTEAELRWKEHFIRTVQLFKETSIETEFFTADELNPSEPSKPNKNQIKRK